MSRLQKKCVIGSAVFHGVLFLVLLIGAAFSRNKPTEEMTTVEFVDLSKVIAVDAPGVTGGGNPNVKTPPAPAAKRPDPKPEVKLPEPAPIKNPPAPKPSKPEKLHDPEPDKNEPGFEPVKPPKREIKINTDQVVHREAPKEDKAAVKARAEREAKEAKEAKEAAEAYDRARSERAAALNALGSRISNLEKGLAGSTGIEMPGPGGQAYASYLIIVLNYYEQAWRTPSEGRDDDSTATAEVVIAQDGRVVSSKLVKRSSNPALNKSVQETLDRVRKVAPFPEGAKDAERTFRINFNLKSKTRIG